MILGFTGTLMGMTPEQKTVAELRIAGLRPNVFIHGGAAGADTDVHRIVIHRLPPNDLPHTIEIYPEDSPLRRRHRYWRFPEHRIAAKASGRDLILHDPDKPLARNLIIVQRCDHLLATPASRKEMMRGSGTWATIRYARKAGKPHTIIWPDGEVELASDRKSATMLF
jgi:hypothetical protein